MTAFSQAEAPEASDHSYSQAPATPTAAPASTPQLTTPLVSHPPSILEVTTTKVATISHIPKGNRNRFSKILCTSLENVVNNPSYAAVESLLSIAKCVLAAPPRRSRLHGKDFAKMVDGRLAQWASGGVAALWKEVTQPLPRRRNTAKTNNAKSSTTSELTAADDHKRRLTIRAAQDGQYSKAAKILSSDGIAPPSSEVKAAMERLHPQASLPTFTEDPPPAASISEEDVQRAVLSFPEGTAPGPSGCRAAFLKESINCPSGIQGRKTLAALTKFVNCVAAGKLPLETAQFFCGATIHAANKKVAGTFRPIAVGEVFRRVVAKCLAFGLGPQAATFLEPRQLGVKTRGGTEAIIHAVQAVLSDPLLPSNSKWVVQVDFRNAFNTIDRTALLKEVRQRLPGLSAFAEWCYGAKSRLLLGGDVLSSTSGVQQGDPLGPLLFAICLLLLVRRVEEAAPNLVIHAWFLDDGTFVGSPLEVFKAFRVVQDFAPQLGLQVNMEKSTLWRSLDARDADSDALLPSPLGISEIEDEGFVLLGAPVGSAAFSRSVVTARVEKLSVILSKVATLQDPQVQLALVRSCFGLPKFAYCLRTCDPAIASYEFADFDDAQCQALSSIVAAPLSTEDPHWILASLPVSLGGLGLRSAAIHSAAAFIASTLQTEALVKKLLDPITSRRDTSVAASLLTNATAHATTPLPSGAIDSKTPQRLLSRRVDESRLYVLDQMTSDERFRITLQSVRQKGTGAYLNVIPSPALGLSIPPREFTLALKYRLGLPVYPATGPCPLCHKDSDLFGDHAILACVVGGDRTRRHDKLVDAIFERAQAALLHPRKEERRLLDDDSRPGDVTFERPWPLRPGKAKIAFDVTVVSPLRQDARANPFNPASYVLDKAREAKFRKYEGKLPREIGLIPLPVSTFGAWEDIAAANLKELVRAQSATLRVEPGKLQRHFFERLSVILQRENGAMLLERSPLQTLPPNVDGLV